MFVRPTWCPGWIACPWIGLCLVITWTAVAFGWSQEKSGVEEREAEASELWVSAFSWMQTGGNLAKARQWPLALGSYIEALQKFQMVSREFPEFEPELVTFRIRTLEETVRSTQKNLASDDHDVMMQYLDFVESVEKGMELRYQNKFEEALPALRFAQSLLDEIIAKRPSDFRAAVDSQYLRLEENIEWMEAQLNWKNRSLPQVAASGREILGTTEFIKESDMPTNAMVAMSGYLFPNVPAPQEGADAVEKNEAGSKEKAAAPKNRGSALMRRLPKSFGPGASVSHPSPEMGKGAGSAE